MAWTILMPGRTIFGRGAADTAPELISGLGRRILLVRGSAPGADRLEAALSARAEVLTLRHHGEPDLPALTAALDRARPFAPDVIVAIGGGSVLDLGKALAALVPSSRDPLDHLEVVGRGLPLDQAPLPLVAIPTTAGTGAEATRNAVIGVPEHARKVSLRDDRMIPDVALVDPALTDHSPRAVTLASGLDAVVQVIEPYLSSRATPFTDALCRAAIPQGLAALRRLMEAEDPAARDALAHVSLTGGIALSNAGLGAVHGLAGVLGGRHPAPHGALCGRLLVPVLRANRAALTANGHSTDRIDEITAMIARTFSTSPDKALETLDTWATNNGLPDLATLCVTPLDPQATARDAAASSSMKANPVPVSEDTLAAILDAA
ncbi:alcohol dehydrogenase [Oceanicola sp. 22II-s10i]|uniref:iron-containing alcohol dehydrogenase n=1 Tax=Oceanicola sp. 22II-s10i TaxID=1317116 RepID=UPI000B51F7FD|nr:iron-containing alcohol dehydrogenase [Oceanicola sp. 22II-s10i]OWU83750.1 alcohol dehydrogenase [Oceanicola sp. 22II-s10i]